MKLIDADVVAWGMVNIPQDPRQKINVVLYSRVISLSLQGWSPASRSSWTCLIDTNRRSYKTLRASTFPYTKKLPVLDGELVERWPEWRTAWGARPTLDEVLGFEDTEKER